MSDKSKFSSKTEPLNQPPGNPAKFPFTMFGTAAFLGGILYVGGVEDRIVAMFPSAETAASLCTVAGGMALTAAHGHAMVYNANGRILHAVPHPLGSNDVGYCNASRGYYNMVEHMPFFLLNTWLAHNAGKPCVAGMCMVLNGIGRIIYTISYAQDGPKARKNGFVLATFSSMACLGIAMWSAASSAASAS